jgi:hypothetical protein
VTPILTLDFEASCLPKHGRSFPIEVGISDLRGVSRSWLIQPHDSWRTWAWTAEAERLHGLDRGQLEREGLPADQVLAALAGAVDGAYVVADCDLDADWLKTLA